LGIWRIRGLVEARERKWTLEAGAAAGGKANLVMMMLS